MLGLAFTMYLFRPLSSIFSVLVGYLIPSSLRASNTNNDSHLFNSLASPQVRMSFGTGSTGLALILQSIHELNVFTDHSVAVLEILKGGSVTGARSAAEIFGVATPTFSHVNAFIQYSWKAEPRGPSQKKSRTLSNSVVSVNYNFN